MDEFEAMQLLFKDCFIAALIIPFEGESIFTAMRVLGGYSNTMMFATALVSSTLGSCVNYATARMLVSKLYAIQKGQSKFLERRVKMHSLAHGPLAVMLILSPHHLWGGIVTFLIGAAELRFSWFIAIIIGAKAIYYGLLLWT